LCEQWDAIADAFYLDALVDLDAQLTALHSRLSVFNCTHLLRDDASPLPVTLVDGLDRAAAPMRAAQALCNLVERATRRLGAL
jgi:GAF domain-containing protein